MPIVTQKRSLQRHNLSTIQKQSIHGLKKSSQYYCPLSVKVQAANVKRAVFAMVELMIMVASGRGEDEVPKVSEVNEGESVVIGKSVISGSVVDKSVIGL